MVIYDRKNPDAAIPQLEKKVSDLEKSFIDRAYPVGSYFFTSKANYNPSILGGEWELTNNTDPYKWERIR